MVAQIEELEHHEKVGRLEADVQNLTISVNGLATKIDKIVDGMAQKPLGVGAIVSIVAGGLGSIAIISGFVLYIINASLAPVVSSISQQANSIQSTNSLALKTANDIQLANKEITVVANKASDNKDTLQWFLFTENIPKQLTELNLRVQHLEEKGNK